LAKQHFLLGDQKIFPTPAPSKAFRVFKSKAHVYFSKKIAALLFLREQIGQPQFFLQVQNFNADWR